MRKNLRRLVALLLILIVVALLAVAYDFIFGIRWIGGYSAQVHTERTSPRPIKTASVITISRRVWETAEGDPACIDTGCKTVAISDGGSFTIEVTCVGTNSGLGWKNRYSCQEVLVLKLDYADGGTQWVVADLAPSYGKRELFLQVP